MEELTTILNTIDRQDVAKKAKESIGKLNRRKTTDFESKALMLRDCLQLATKHCEILVDQVDYLKIAANKDGNKRIEQIASEAKENLISQVQKKLKYASALYSAPKLISVLVIVRVALHPCHPLKAAQLIEVQSPVLLL